MSRMIEGTAVSSREKTYYCLESDAKTEIFVQGQFTVVFTSVINQRKKNYTMLSGLFHEDFYEDEMTSLYQGH